MPVVPGQQYLELNTLHFVIQSDVNLSIACGPQTLFNVVKASSSISQSSQSVLLLILSAFTFSSLGTHCDNNTILCNVHTFAIGAKYDFF
jgi:hypothetical protein